MPNKFVAGLRVLRIVLLSVKERLDLPAVEKGNLHRDVVLVNTWKVGSHLEPSFLHYLSVVAVCLQLWKLPQLFVLAFQNECSLLRFFGDFSAHRCVFRNRTGVVLCGRWFCGALLKCPATRYNPAEVLRLFVWSAHIRTTLFGAQLTEQNFELPLIYEG